MSGGSADPKAGSSIPDTNVQTHGGKGGLEAKFEDFGAMGRLTDDIGADGLAIAGKGHKYLVDPNVIASAILDPAGAAKFEGAMLGALDGPNGLTAAAGAIELRSVTLRAAEAAYQLADEANENLLSDLEWLIGAADPAVVPAALLAVLGTGTANALVDFVKNGGDLSKLPADEIAELQKAIVEHPGLVDATINAIPGALSRIQGFPVDLQQGAAELGLLMPDGVPRTVGVPYYAKDKDGNDIKDASGKPIFASQTDQDTSAKNPPQNLGDIMAELQHRNTTAANDNNTGPNIDVRKVTGPDGKTRWIVDVPGTKVWTPSTPSSNNPNINDLGTNIVGLSGQETTLQKAIDQAMQQAGVKATDPVMLVGHSQGGIVAANAAADWTNEHKYNITNLVTAGAPVGLVAMPSNVQVLSIENNYDIVPRLDGRSNPDSSNWTTVTFDHQTGTVFGNHGMGGKDDNGYTSVAYQLANSADPSVQAFNQSLAANGYTTGASVDTYQYYATREPA